MYERGRCLIPLPENALTDCTSMYAICAAPVGVSVENRIVGLWVSVSHDLAAVPDASSFEFFSFKVIAFFCFHPPTPVCSCLVRHSRSMPHRCREFFQRWGTSRGPSRPANDRAGPTDC